MSSLRVNNKVGPRNSSSTTPCAVEAAKRLRTMHFASKAPDSAVQGILVWLLKYEALLAVLSSRENTDDIMIFLRPLASLVAIAKKVVRKRGGVRVTRTMREDLRQVLSWKAKTCSSVLDGGEFKYDTSRDNDQTEVRFMAKEAMLRIRLGATRTPQSAYPSTPTAPATPPPLPPLPRTRENSMDSTSPHASSRSGSIPGAVVGGGAIGVGSLRVEAVSPGVQVASPSASSSRSDSISGDVGGDAVMVGSPRVEGVSLGGRVALAGQAVVAAVNLLAAKWPGIVTFCSQMTRACFVYHARPVFVALLCHALRAILLVSLR